MANGLDIVAVRIKYERSIVIWMVVWAYSRLSVILAARRDRLTMKSIYGRPISCCKGDVSTCLGGFPQSDPEKGLGTDAVASGSFAFRIKPHYSQRTQR